MVETVLAVLVVSAVFFGLFRLSRLLTGKILLEHAAMRVARARAVGFNDFMCRKTARVAVIPVAGKRLWPDPEKEDESANYIGGDFWERIKEFLGFLQRDETKKVLHRAQNDKTFTYRVRTYLESPDEARARGLLEYEGWGRLGIDPGDGGQSVVTLPVEGVRLQGKAGIEDGASYYMGRGSQ